MACPTISTARAPRSCSSTKRSLASTAAPEPSEVGEHCNLVSPSGSYTILAAVISSSVYTFWNCAYGLFAECRWFFSAIFAKCVRVEPYRSMCSTPAAPNIHGATGIAKSRSCARASM